MAPHLCATELNSLHQWLSKGFETPEMLRRIAKQRERRGVEAPKLRQIQRLLQGASFKRGVLETRGRKKKLSSRNIKTLNAKRMDLIKKAKGEREVHWREIIQKARVPHVHPATAGRSLRAAGFAVAARTPRQKPMRSPDHEAIRVELCSKWMRRPATYFTDSVDLIMDNKQWNVPLTVLGKRYNNMRQVRFHIRTRGEGVSAGFTKPNAKRHRVNTRGVVKVCAGIIGCKIRLWH